MRYDVDLSLVASVEAFDEAEAQDMAERLATRLEIETEWIFGSSLISPRPLAVVQEVTEVP